uniref:Uncharacterized protein n=1 Tax=Timema poppense TaxID=170557 RepID=A0A7R9H925_TIMPO|nr:unnamed protein product [Timema poppensis]
MTCGATLPTIRPLPIPSLFNPAGAKLSSQAPPLFLRGRSAAIRVLPNHPTGGIKKSRLAASWDQSPVAKLSAGQPPPWGNKPPLSVRLYFISSPKRPNTTSLPARFTAVTNRTFLPARFTAVTRRTFLPARFTAVTRRTPFLPGSSRDRQDMINDATNTQRLPSYNASQGNTDEFILSPRSDYEQVQCKHSLRRVNRAKTKETSQLWTVNSAAQPRASVYSPDLMKLFVTRHLITINAAATPVAYADPSQKERGLVRCVCSVWTTDQWWRLVSGHKLVCARTMLLSHWILVSGNYHQYATRAPNAEGGDRKKRKDQNKSGSSASKYKPYKYSDLMSFLKKVTDTTVGQESGETNESGEGSASHAEEGTENATSAEIENNRREKNTKEGSTEISDKIRKSTKLKRKQRIRR